MTKILRQENCPKIKIKNGGIIMIKSNTVKRLIGTGAIAFAFFSASLAMGTPVKA